jgi:hypothetical protein
LNFIVVRFEFGYGCGFLKGRAGSAVEAAARRPKLAANPWRTNRRGRWHKSGLLFNAPKFVRLDAGLQLQNSKKNVLQAQFETVLAAAGAAKNRQTAGHDGKQTEVFFTEGMSVNQGTEPVALFREA